MTSYHSSHRPTIMNNSLHNDLERLGHASSYSSRKMSPHPTLNSSDLNRSTLSYSKRVRFADPNEQLEVIRKPEFSSKDIEEAASKGIKVQRELMDLQSKVLALERRISSVYSPTHIDIVKENWQSCYNVRMNTADSENRPPIQKQNVLKASLKSSGSEWAKTTGNFEDSGLLEQNKLKLSGSSSHRSRSRPKSHRRRLSDASFMKEKTVKRDYSRSNMNDSYEYSSMRLTTDMAETKKFKANDQEVLILNRNIDKLRKEYEEDKEALACEKAKGKNLSEEVRKLTKQMQEAKINLDNAKKAKKNFDKLKESYERSEEVKEQQKQLISNLDYELALLKAEKYKLLEGKKNEEAKRCKDSYKKAKIAMKIGKSYY